MDWTLTGSESPQEPRTGDPSTKVAKPLAAPISNSWRLSEDYSEVTEQPSLIPHPSGVDQPTDPNEYPEWVKKVVEKGWQPNTDGKAIETKNGEYIAWTTDVEEGEPHHYDVMQVFGIDEGVVVGYLAIDPSGQYYDFSASFSDWKFASPYDFDYMETTIPPGMTTQEYRQERSKVAHCPRCGWFGPSLEALAGCPICHEGDLTWSQQKLPKKRFWQASWQFTAGNKLHDFLMNPKSRPDLQKPEAQEFLKWLEQHFHNDKTDALMPWVVREWKKGRLKPAHELPGYEHIAPGLAAPGAWNGNDVTIQPHYLDHIADWFHSNDESRRGVDIMQLKTPELTERIRQWDEDQAAKQHDEALKGGQVAHQYDDGWTVRKLGPEDCEAEGSAMGHCVGGYANDVDKGRTLIYSLRDEKNRPHATMEIEPTNWENDPNWLEEAFAKDPVARAMPDEHKNALRGFHDYVRNIYDRGHEPTFRHDDKQLEWQGLYNTLAGKYSGGKPVPHDGNLVQVQGKANAEPLPEYKDRIKQWMGSFPEDQRPKSVADSEISHINHIMPEAETYENLDYDPYYGNYNPEEYGLGDDRPTNYAAMVESLDRPRDHYEWRAGERSYDPDEGKALYDHAVKRGEVPQLADAVTNQQTHAWDDFNNLEDANLDNLPPYPGEEYNPEEAEYMGLENQDEWNEAKEYYDQSRADLMDEHVPSQVVNHMYEMINPHYNQETRTWQNMPQTKPATFASTHPVKHPNARRKITHPHWKHGHDCNCGFITHLGGEWNFTASEARYPVDAPILKLHDGQKLVGQADEEHSEMLQRLDIEPGDVAAFGYTTYSGNEIEWYQPGTNVNDVNFSWGF